MSKTTALHEHHAFQYISLTSTARLRRETSQSDVWCTTWTYYDNFPFSIWTWIKPLRIQLQEKSPTLIWRIERFQIDAIKFEMTQIHFFKWFFMFSLPSSSSSLSLVEVATVHRNSLKDRYFPDWQRTVFRYYKHCYEFVSTFCHKIF